MSLCCRPTNHSWSENAPAGVSTIVRSRSSVAGRTRTSTPNAAAIRAVTADSGSPGAQRLRPHEVEPEVAVAELEPRLVVAERPGRVERVPRLAAAAPAALLVVEVGERVDDAVEVGRDVQAEELVVVADVPDHRHLARPDEVDEAADEARAADAAREHDHFRHGLTLPFGVAAV